MGENKMSLFTGGEQANVVRGDDLKVHPTEWIHVAQDPQPKGPWPTSTPRRAHPPLHLILPPYINTSRQINAIIC